MSLLLFNLLITDFEEEMGKVKWRWIRIKKKGYICDVCGQYGDASRRERRNKKHDWETIEGYLDRKGVKD